MLGLAHLNGQLTVVARVVTVPAAVALAADVEVLAEASLSRRVWCAPPRGTLYTVDTHKPS